MKIIVTGSSGMIGTALCDELMKRNIDFYPVDKKPNIFNEEINKRTIICDLASKNLDLPTDADLVVHLAANARVHNLVINPDLAKENIDALYYMLEFCRKNDIKKFIFSSSREVYGERFRECYEESDVDISHILSSYTASKIAGEALVRSYTECYSIDHIVLRFSNVYGRYDFKDRLVPLYISLAKEDKDLLVFGLNKKLDFTYIDDTVNGIIRSIESFKSTRNDVYNICGGEAISVEYVAQQIIKKLGSKSKIKYLQNRTGEISFYQGSNKKAKNIMGFIPMTNIDMGIDKSISWYEDKIY